MEEFELTPQPVRRNWLKSKSIYPDILILSLFSIATLLWTSFNGQSAGSSLNTVRILFENILGTGRYIVIFLLFYIALGLLLLRYTKYCIILSKKTNVLTSIILIALFPLFSVSKSGTGGYVGNKLADWLQFKTGKAGVTIFYLFVIIACLFELFKVRELFPRILNRCHEIWDKIFPRNEEAFTAEAVQNRANAAIESFLKSQEDEKPSTFDDNDEHDISMNKATTQTNKNHIQMRSNRLPPLNLLTPEMGLINKNVDVSTRIEEIETAMDEFGTPVIVKNYSIGPGIIQYQVIPGSITSTSGRRTASASKNIRVNQVGQLERDLAVRLGVSNLSIQAPVPGESFIGIDLPNPDALKVRLRPLIESPQFKNKKSSLSIALGRDISGEPVVVDLAQMPHLLIGGTTNSGKSILLRSIAICLVMNSVPEDLRLVMIDPKRVELFRFNGLPHLLGKVETEYERSIAVLGWAVEEMRSRYRLFETAGKRQLSAYNDYAKKQGLKTLPHIVIFIDEMAEIMKGADKTGQEYIDILASLARATGMHLVVATQRPDTTIITGKIKTNIPARIALNVASNQDSRVIMGKSGAEKLLGRGDMYFIDPSISVPLRVQGPMLTDQEIDAVVALWRKLAPKPAEEANNEAPWSDFVDQAEREELEKDEKKIKEAIRYVCRTRKATAASLQSKLNVSFSKASKLLDRLETLGVVGPMQVGGKSREVIWSEDEADSYGTDAGWMEE